MDKDELIRLLIAAIHALLEHRTRGHIVRDALEAAEKLGFK